MADSPTSKPVDYPKVLHFFTNPDTCELHERQLVLLRRINRQTSEGFRIDELPYVSEIFKVVHERVDVQVSLKSRSTSTTVTYIFSVSFSPGKNEYELLHHL